MKTLVLIALLSVPCLAQISVKYDKFQNVTTVETEIRYAKALKGKQLLPFRLAAVHDDKTPSENLEEIYLVFYPSRSLQSYELIILVNGYRVPVIDVTRNGKDIYAVISLSTAKLIAEAKTAEFQLGQFEGRFSQKDKNTFRNIIQSALASAAK